MLKQSYIKDIQANTEIKGIFLVQKAEIKEARNGPFWRIEIADMTGSLEAKIWSPLSQQFTEIPVQSFIEIVGRSSLYRDQVQISIDSMYILNQEQIDILDMNHFVACSPYNVDDMLAELEVLCKKTLTHKPWQKFVFSVLKDEEIRQGFSKAPAAKSIHQAYLGGLLEHSLAVSKLCMSLAQHYPLLDKQVLLVAAIFHDLGKIWEFSYGLVTDYSDEGRLLGHMHLVLEHLQPFLKKSGLEPELILHFKHLILSHHGTYEFGSSRLPQTAEAFLLHYADNIDAKMSQCQSLFDAWEEKEVGWSPYQKTLERYVFKPMRTPNTVQESKKSKSKNTIQQTMEDQCLLL